MDIPQGTTIDRYLDPKKTEEATGHKALIAGYSHAFAAPFSHGYRAAVRSIRGHVRGILASIDFAAWRLSASVSPWHRLPNSHDRGIVASHPCRPKQTRCRRAVVPPG